VTTLCGVLSQMKCEIEYCFQNCALLGFNAGNSGKFLLTFRDSQLVPSSRVKTWP